MSPKKKNSAAVSNRVLKLVYTLVAMAAAFFIGLQGAWVFLSIFRYDIVNNEHFYQTHEFDSMLAADLHTIRDYVYYEGGNFTRSSLCYTELISDLDRLVDSEASVAINLVATRDQLRRSAPEGLELNSAGEVRFVAIVDSQRSVFSVSDRAGYDETGFAGSGELVVGENTDAAATEAAKTWFSSYFDCLTALTAYTSRPLIVNAEEILAEVEASYRNEYSDALATLTASYAEVQDKIDEMTSVRFICRDTRTGAVYSNVGANSVTPDALGELRRGSELDLDVDAAGASVRIGTDDLSGEYARTAFQSLGAELYLTVAPSYISADPYSNYFYCYELCSRNLTLW
nr:hypothetical protein [Clostridia bacterium]